MAVAKALLTAAGFLKSTATERATAEHIAAGAETIMSMQAIVTEFSASSTDDAQDLVNAAQVIVKNNQNGVRNRCKPWGCSSKPRSVIVPWTLSSTRR